MLTLGTQLSPKTRRDVLNRFVHRLTTENGYPNRNPCKARVPAISDAQWLAEHAFYTNRDGSLSERYDYCEPAFMVEA
jgi:hypothetical protein